MPLFYFHVCDGEEFREDPNGLDLADEEAARQEAIRSVRELRSRELQHGGLNPASFIEVEDEDRQLLFTVTLEEKVSVRSRR